MKNVERQCAYCHGVGKDPFGILSTRSTCGVCGGKGQVRVPTPYIQCAHCKGTGAIKRFSCTVCRGTGVVYREAMPLITCPTCHGSGDDSSLPALECLNCHGRGWLTVK